MMDGTTRGVTDIYKVGLEAKASGVRAKLRPDLLADERCSFDAIRRGFAFLCLVIERRVTGGDKERRVKYSRYEGLKDGKTNDGGEEG